MPENRATIGTIRLVVSETRAGDIRHELWVVPTRDALYLLHTLEGNTADSQVLEYRADAPAEDVRYVRVVTTLRPSRIGFGGSGTNEETENKAAEVMSLTDQQLEVLHNPTKGGQTQFQYGLAWARTYLRKCGLIDSSSRGVWALTPVGAKLDHVDEKQVVRTLLRSVRPARPWFRVGAGYQEPGLSRVGAGRAVRRADREPETLQNGGGHDRAGFGDGAGSASRYWRFSGKHVPKWGAGCVGYTW